MFFRSCKKPRRDIQENPEALRKKALHLPFDFEKYYDAIAEFTFRSEFFPILPDTVQAMVNYYQARFNSKFAMFSEHDVVLLQHLEKDIAKHLRKFGAGAVFVRMSNRSPKDGMPLLTNGETVSARFEQAIAFCPANDPDVKMAILSDLQLKLLKCESAKQVMNLLLASERVFVDLLLALDCYHASLDDVWSTCVILREWNEQLRGDFEFRVFVHERKITAISQYNRYCKFNSLYRDMTAEQIEALQKQIMAYVESVQPHIAQSSYVIDVAMIENKLFVIELNPFQTTTGAALFDWRTDEDTLYGRAVGSLPPFRIRQTTMEGLEEFVNYLLRETHSMTPEPYDAYYSTLLSHVPCQP